VHELRGIDNLPEMLDLLARVEPNGDVRLEDLMQASATEITTGSITVIITPRSPTDERVRERMEMWAQPPISSTLHLFWLNGESFVDAHQRMRVSAFSSPQEVASGAGGSYGTVFGREYEVLADTNLIALLGGPIFG
jgi:hypothetical protein